MHENFNIKALRVLGMVRHLASMHGISGFTLDDVANQLNISKKTIYTNFKNKEDIIGILLQRFLDKFQVELQSPLISGNLADQLKLILSKTSGLYQLFTLEVILALKNKYPQTFSEFEHFENKVLIKSIKNNIDFGIENNEYRKKINSKILACFIVSMIKHLNHKQILIRPNHCYQLSSHFINGLLNNKLHRFDS